MPALPEDIAAGTRQATVERWQSSTMKARYPSARDGLLAPSEGFFDDPAHAAAAAAQRGALIGTERRRFKAVADGLLWLDPAASFPCVQVIDPEQGVNATGLVSRMEVNLETGQTILEVMV